MSLEEFETKDGITETEMPSVREHLAALNLEDFSEVGIAPEGLFSATSAKDLRHEYVVYDVRNLLRQIGIEAKVLNPKDKDIPSRQNRSELLALPPIVLSAWWLYNNFDKFKEIVSKLKTFSITMVDRLTGRVTFTSIIEDTDNKKSVRTEYKGPPEKLDDVINHIERTQKRLAKHE